MGAIAGYQGKFQLSTTPMVQVKTCKINVKGQVYDVTAMSGLSATEWKAFIGGLQEWTLDVTGNFDFVSDTLQSTLFGDLGQTVSISYSPNTGTNKFSGSAILTQIPMGFDVSKESTVQFSFQGTGALTYM